jgi:PilZ domain
MSRQLGPNGRCDRRENFRTEWNVSATIYDADRHLERPCVLIDLSSDGAKIAGVRARTIPDEFRLRTPNGDRRSCRVIWRTEDALGVEFTNHTDGEVRSSEQPGAREPKHA